MPVSSFALLIMVASVATGAAMDSRAATHEGSVRLERCEKLQTQLLAALANPHAAERAETAKTLGSKATRLCSSHKEALGARTYVKALSLLGVKHIDIR